MKRISIWIAGSMALVAFLAIDFAVIPAFQNVETLPPRVGLYGVLPMAYVLAVCLAIVVSRLVHRGEVALSTVAFLLFGGTATLALVAFSNLAPQLFFMYISNTAGLWVRPGQQIADVFLFGTGGNRVIQALVIGAAVTPPLLIPALLAGCVTRSYRVKLLKGADAERDSGRALTGEQRAARRIRISVAGLMALVALVAFDFVVIRSFRNVASQAARGGLFWALPMAHVLAAYLVIVVSNLVRRGEVALSRVAFLLSGGTAMLVFVTIITLAPTLFFMYIDITADRWLRSGQNVSSQGRIGIGYTLIRSLLVCSALTAPLLVPALFAGWVTRGYRLKVLET